MKKKIMIVFGTRPEAIKMVPIYFSFFKDQNLFDVSLCVTGQHKELLDQVLDLYQIVPNFNLNIMKSGQNLSEMTSSVFRGMQKVLSEIKPNALLVHGDTTTSFASAVSGFYNNIPVGHVEAGLRTFDLQAPFPEELNRQLISRIARWHFTPTTNSKENLINEGVIKKNIFVTGNTIVDAMKMCIKKINSDITIKRKIVSFLVEELKFSFRSKKFILITGHRRENIESGFKNICLGIKKAAEKNPNVHFIYSVHLNPLVYSQVSSILKNKNNIHLIKPVNYEVFIYLLNKCYFVITDSGGIQEEAPSFGKPVLITRNKTERPEPVQGGSSLVVGTNVNKIVKFVDTLINNRDVYKKMSIRKNYYGNGNASKKITKIVGRAI